MTSTLEQAAKQLAKAVGQAEQRIVFAESCTAGLASASLAAVPGISQWHCGSAVTYREQTKTDWLGVSADAIAQHGVVSDVVARQMARGVLERTEEADLSVSVTGHLGPDAPEELDGVIFIAVAQRTPKGTVDAHAWRHILRATDRRTRQHEAAQLLLQRATQKVSGTVF